MTETPGDSSVSWPVTASVDLHRDDWLVALRSDTVHRPGHPEETFARVVLEHPGAVIVLAVDDDERAACVRQYRHPATGTFLELPAGLRDSDGEDPLETAKRELAEEIGKAADTWEHLTSFYTSPGFAAEEVHLYLATGLSDEEAEAEEEERIEIVEIPLDELDSAIADCHDSKSLVGLLWFRAFRSPSP